MQDWWNDTEKENSNTSGKNVVLAPLNLHQIVTEWPVIETGAPQRKDGD